MFPKRPVPDLQGAYPATFKTTEAEIKDIDLKIFEEVGEMTIESAMVSQKTGNAYAKEKISNCLLLKSIQSVPVTFT